MMEGTSNIASVEFTQSVRCCREKSSLIWRCLVKASGCTKIRTGCRLTILPLLASMENLADISEPLVLPNEKKKDQ